MLGMFYSWFISIYDVYYTTGTIYITLFRYTRQLLDIMNSNDVFMSIRAVFVMVGMGLVAVYFFIELGEKITAKNYNMETFIRSVMKMVFVLIIMAAFPYIVRYGILQGSALMSRSAVSEADNSSFFSEKTPDTEEYREARQEYEKLKNKDAYEKTEEGFVYENTIDGVRVVYMMEPDGTIVMRRYRYEDPSMTDLKSGTLDEVEVHAVGTYGTKFQEGLHDDADVSNIGYVLKAFIPWLIAFISEIVIFFVAFSRTAELLLRILVSPVVIADIYTNGKHSYGISYIRKMFALMLQFAVIVVISAVTSEILRSAPFGGGGKSITNILLEGNFSTEACLKFVKVLLQGGGYWSRVALVTAKIVMILRSMPICEDIVGA